MAMNRDSWVKMAQEEVIDIDAELVLDAVASSEALERRGALCVIDFQTNQGSVGFKTRHLLLKLEEIMGTS